MVCGKLSDSHVFSHPCCWCSREAYLCQQDAAEACVCQDVHDPHGAEVSIHEGDPDCMVRLHGVVCCTAAKCGPAEAGYQEAVPRTLSKRLPSGLYSWGPMNGEMIVVSMHAICFTKRQANTGCFAAAGPFRHNHAPSRTPRTSKTWKGMWMMGVNHGTTIPYTNTGTANANGAGGKGGIEYGLWIFVQLLPSGPPTRAIR